MQNKKKVRIFAGPNGSVKSTLFVEFSKIYQTGYFVNADFTQLLRGITIKNYQLNLNSKNFNK